MSENLFRDDSAYINPESALAGRFWENRILPDCPIFDFHGHMHEFVGGFMPACSPESMDFSLHYAGIKSFLFCSHQSLCSAEIGETANINGVHQLTQDGMFRAYLAVRSYDLDFERDKAIYEANPDVYAGLKFWPDYFNVPLEAECHQPYWQYADERKLLCLTHTWGGSRFDGADSIRAIAERYRNITLICGHSVHGDWDSAIRLANEFSNVYLELTAVLDDRGILERFVAEAGSEKILFGTDLPWFSTFHGIGCILDADITDDDRRNILYRNGKRLLKRFPWYQEL